MKDLEIDVVVKNNKEVYNHVNTDLEFSVVPKNSNQVIVDKSSNNDMVERLLQMLNERDYEIEEYKKQLVNKEMKINLVTKELESIKSALKIESVLLKSNVDETSWDIAKQSGIMIVEGKVSNLERNFEINSEDSSVLGTAVAKQVQIIKHGVGNGNDLSRFTNGKENNCQGNSYQVNGMFKEQDLFWVFKGLEILHQISVVNQQQRMESQIFEYYKVVYMGVNNSLMVKLLVVVLHSLGSNNGLIAKASYGDTSIQSFGGESFHKLSVQLI